MCGLSLLFSLFDLLAAIDVMSTISGAKLEAVDLGTGPSVCNKLVFDEDEASIELVGEVDEGGSDTDAGCVRVSTSLDLT